MITLHVLPNKLSLGAKIIAVSIPLNGTHFINLAKMKGRVIHTEVQPYDIHVSKHNLSPPAHSMPSLLYGVTVL